MEMLFVACLLDLGQIYDTRVISVLYEEHTALLCIEYISFVCRTCIFMSFS